MRISGYSHRERYEAVRGAIMRYETMKKMVSDGVISSISRTREEIKAAKEAKGGCNTNTWYLKGNTSRVVKVQATPGGILADKVKESLNQ